MATETLRPNAAGDETALFPVTAPNWDEVNDVVPDEYISGVNTASAAYLRDLYNLPASAGAGVINFIKIYFRCATYGGGGVDRFAKPSLKSNATVTDGTEVGPLGAFFTYSEQWNLNPADAGAWAWADIDALQIGVSLKGAPPNSLGFCTQVYVEIDYTPPLGWTGKISGVTNPASIMGVDVANIASVKGVV